MDILDHSELPSPLPGGMAQAIEAALEAAGHSATVSLSPDGMLVSNADIARGVIASFAGSAAELDHARSRKLDALAAVLAAKFEAGRSYNGKTFQIDDKSRSSISATVALASSGSLPEDFAWIAADNSSVPMNMAAMLLFAADVAAYVSALVLRNRALKDAITAASDVKSLGAIDINSGWPAN